MALFASLTFRAVGERVMAGVSSSSTAASKVADTPVYSLLVAVLAAWAISTLSSWPSRSCCAVAITVCGMFQFVVVNVRVDMPTVTAPGSGLVMVTVTGCVGCAARRTE